MKILLVGCGRMGGAMARGWERAHEVWVFDPHAATLPDGAEPMERLEDFRADRDTAVILAVKPQIFPDLAPLLRPLATSGALFVSIMAGISLRRLGDALGDTHRLVRAMPNTAASIGGGVTAIAGTVGIGTDDRNAVDALLAPTGRLIWLDDECLIDAVTAVSGSGPAYYFRFTEALAAAGAAQGLPAELSTMLARATFEGSAALSKTGELSLDELRQQVTSPGGTTAAGLAQMEKDDGIDRLVATAVAAAARRSRELAG